MNKRKGRYLYVLNHIPHPYLGLCWPNNGKELNCWGRRNRWPRPNGHAWLLFADRFAAEEFLFKQERKGRKVKKKWRPRRIYISLKGYRDLIKNNFIEGVAS